jgi:uridine kinase
MEFIVSMILLSTPINKKFNDICNRILELKEHRNLKERPFVVGIDGIDCSGKTTLAKKIKKALDAQNIDNQIIHLDDFHFPKIHRYKGGEKSWRNYFNRSHNIARIVDEILIPIVRRHNFKKKLKLLDLDSDTFSVTKTYQITKNTIVIFEGVFLFREELVKYIDLKIYIDISFERALKRVIKRDVPLYGDLILLKYHEKYYPAQRYYIESVNPKKIADIIIKG